MNKKAAYIEKSEAKLEEYTARLNELKAKAEGEIADQKIDASEQIDQLEMQIKTAKAHLTELSHAAEDSWEDLANRFDSLANDLSASVKKFFS